MKKLLIRLGAILVIIGSIKGLLLFVGYIIPEIPEISRTSCYNFECKEYPSGWQDNSIVTTVHNFVSYFYSPKWTDEYVVVLTYNFNWETGIRIKEILNLSESINCRKFPVNPSRIIPCYFNRTVGSKSVTVTDKLDYQKQKYLIYWFILIGILLGSGCIIFFVWSFANDLIYLNRRKTEHKCLISYEIPGKGIRYLMCSLKEDHVYIKKEFDQWVAMDKPRKCVYCSSKLDDEIYVNN